LGVTASNLFNTVYALGNGVGSIGTHATNALSGIFDKLSGTLSEIFGKENNENQLNQDLSTAQTKVKEFVTSDKEKRNEKIKGIYSGNGFLATDLLSPY
jgi:hypothetical protein